MCLYACNMHIIAHKTCSTIPQTTAFYIEYLRRILFVHYRCMPLCATLVVAVTAVHYRRMPLCATLVVAVAAVDYRHMPLCATLVVAVAAEVLLTTLSTERACRALVVKKWSSEPPSAGDVPWSSSSSSW